MDSSSSPQALGQIGRNPWVAWEGPALGQPLRAGFWLQALCSSVCPLPPPESKGLSGGWFELSWALQREPALEKVGGWVAWDSRSC